MKNINEETDRARWRRLESHYTRAVGLPPGEREAFLATECADDKRLLAEVMSLLESGERQDSFLGESVFEQGLSVLAAEQSESLTGQTLGPYRLLKHLGRGGMGVVYLAEDPRLGRKVALKLLPATITSDPGQAARFQLEARSASSVSHPHVAHVYETGEDRGRRYIAMEYVEGGTLRTELKRGASPLGRALEIAAQVASALTAAHAVGVVHRDIKPENVMLRPDGYVKVLDFGLASQGNPSPGRSDSSGRACDPREPLMGTVRYMSPEQARGLATDERTDIWSLGVLLYEMLTGRAPFEGETPGDIITSIAENEHAPLLNQPSELSTELERVIGRSLSKDRELRYQSMGDSLAALRRLGAPHAPAAIKSVAVLPFVNVSNHPKAESLSDDIAESLINRLSRIPQLKVIARCSSIKYKGDVADPQEVARALSVEALVTGRVARRGEGLAVHVELVDARDRTQLWGEQYSGRASDLLQAHADISGEIAERLRSQLTPGGRQQPIRRGAVNPEAYELLLKGRFYRYKGGTENWKKAVGYYRQSITVDPAYAPAYVELAFSYQNLVGNSTLDPKKFTPEAEAAARKALELDDSLASAHASLAGLKRDAWDWTAAEREFQHAIELNPHLFGAHGGYSFYLSLMGRHEQAVAESKRARELNPLLPLVNENVAAVCYFARQYDQAIDASKKALELDPNSSASHFILGCVYAAKGMYRDAVAAYREGIKLGGDSPSTQIFLGAAYARAGGRERAQAILKRLESGRTYVSPGELAILYAALGERGHALASLERAYVAHDLQLQFLGVDPAFDSLRADRRFADLMRRVGLPR